MVKASLGWVRADARVIVAYNLVRAFPDPVPKLSSRTLYVALTATPIVHSEAVLGLQHPF